MRVLCLSLAQESAEKTDMIHLTRLNHVPLVVNSDLIEHIESAPDTVIALTTGQKFMVLETAEEVVSRIVKFRRSVLDGMPIYSSHAGLPHSDLRD